MRVAFLADPASPNGWYRGIGPMQALARRGHEIRQLRRPGEDVRAELVRGCDAVHLHRSHDEEALRIARYAKESRIALTWDNDDDETKVPKGNAAYKDYGGLAGERVRAEVRRMVQLADLVTTPSAVLAERFQSLGAERVRLIENYVSDELLDVRAQAGEDQVVIGWLAGLEHHLDVERVPFREALGRLLDAHANVRVVSIGVGLGLRDPRYTHVSGVPFAQLPEQLARFDVGIAPIADIPFNRTRSNVKLKEYAALGVPWLASPIGPYAGMGEREGGRLVPDDAWYPALERLVVKARERRKLAKRASKWGREQAISARVGEWEDALGDAIERAQSAR